jgi:hypothetical protein
MTIHNEKSRYRLKPDYGNYWFGTMKIGLRSLGKSFFAGYERYQK